MLRHAIAPVRRYTKASHDVVRHSRLNSDAKVLLLYVQGLPEAAAPKPLGEHAAKLGMKPRAYQKAKQLLVDCGYFHEWREQGARGRWITEQLLANVTLTREEAGRAREGVAGAVTVAVAVAAPIVCPPGERSPTVGGPGERSVGDSPPREELEEVGEKNLPHPPPEDQAPDTDETAAAEPELVQAEGVLLSLRHVNRELLLGVREARLLADAAAEWLRRGVSAADLRRALTTGLPPDGIRSAAGFLRHRLVQKLPAERGQGAPPAAALGPSPALSSTEWVAVPARRPLVTCPGPGAEHVFRPRNDETHCLRCRTTAAFEATFQPLSVSWRTRVQECAAGA
ncbi:hypothetical protein QFZ75_003427 [Streptomyces sp. V3I8]|uniref:hypothetical protein n=1 Tax=Streptomyces sp. V3I8 TaxID=3042279 RepID=UPI002787AC91|nr:hypothetical protein [Streptomyces sp. V3I8]MDQ1037011.1 hypothetical protein [Streptomyces sp. V3I8]